VGEVGAALGCVDGLRVGDVEGIVDGLRVGGVDGARVGSLVGDGDGEGVGAGVGAGDGEKVGRKVGRVGCIVGFGAANVGRGVGDVDGGLEGPKVGYSVHWRCALGGQYPKHWNWMADIVTTRSSSQSVANSHSMAHFPVPQLNSPLEPLHESEPRHISVVSVDCMPLSRASEHALGPSQ